MASYQRILSHGERDDINIVEEVRLGPVSSMDVGTGETESGLALQLDHIPFDHEADPTPTASVFLFSTEQAFDLMCALIALHGGDVADE